jgi:hypothetical protein
MYPKLEPDKSCSQLTKIVLVVVYGGLWLSIASFPQLHYILPNPV